MITSLFFINHKVHIKETVLSIVKFLKKHDVTVLVPEKNTEELDCKAITSVDPKDINFALSLGGDGTILRFVHEYPNIDAPVIGVNLGTLGFMAAVPISNMFTSLKNIIDGNYRIEKRMMMEGKTDHGDTCFAVNEMVVHRADNPHLIEISVHVGGKLLNTFNADGVIISTPSGSTAYSLSAGGPILTPELEAVVITPISPHTISNRPIVISADKEIEIKYLTKAKPAEISFDGISRFQIGTNETFIIKRSKRNFNLVHLSHQDYFSILRTKLDWTGKLKKK